jgi:capsule polysaccharide export protein KpsC/LpsZ
MLGFINLPITLEDTQEDEALRGPDLKVTLRIHPDYIVGYRESPDNNNELTKSMIILHNGINYLSYIGQNGS